MAGETILVVEDNPLNLELVTDILESKGYTVHRAMTGAEAIELAKDSPPDLILMDIQLPGLDGLTATGILKRERSTRRIPIVALTAHAMRGDEEKAREAGCDAYISKPINTRELPGVIRSILDDAATDRESE